MDEQITGVNDMDDSNAGGAVKAFIKLRQERESFGEKPPSADSAEAPLDAQEGDSRKVNR
jgi:hypothetical protein